MAENENEIQHIEVTPVEVNAIESMERASIDTQIATAHAYPRSISKFIDRAKEMVSVDLETAESCIYRRPVGAEGGVQKFVEGESIRLAEIVAATYGNLRVKVIITEMTPRYVKAMGIAHDLEGNYASAAEVVESTVSKYGQPFSERMRVVVAKAAQSKARRDAIFAVVPKSLCKPIISTAKQMIAGSQRPLAERRSAVALWLTKLSISADRVFAVLSVKGIEELGDDQLEVLTGLRTALRDNEITIDEAFPELQKPEKELTKGVGGVKAALAKTEIIVEPTTEQKTKRAKIIKEQAKKLVEEVEQPIKECRYVCLKCDHEFDVLEDGKTCPNCASDEFLDRILFRPEVQ